MTDPALQAIVDLALREDLGAGDITSAATVPSDLQASASFAARETGVISGWRAVREVYRQVDPDVRIEPIIRCGERCSAGDRLGRLRGPARAILAGERTALNLLQHLSGIASRTAHFVQLVSGTGVRILDTRKTLPGLRGLAKAAVRDGGGCNHRFGLYDGVLIKDNHIAAAGGLEQALRQARSQAHHLLRIEVECDTLEQVTAALDAGADLVLLDNMAPDNLRRAVGLCRGRALTEASGGVTEATVRAIAETGVDFISIGALTHSVRALDIGLDWE